MSDADRFRLPRPYRIGLVSLFFAGAAGGGVAAAMLWVREQPPNISFLVDHKAGAPVDLTIQTVGSLGPNYAQPDWVSYLVKAPDGTWVRTTQWELPAHTRINVTNYEYDSGSPLRNEVWGRITGVIGDEYQIKLNGSKTFRTAYLLDSYAQNGIAHTFTVPGLGINVPFYGVSGDVNLCSAAPCTTKAPHNVIRFSFYTPGPGQYRWQCFVPCGVGYVDGNGGPMDTLGYMAGWLKVLPS